MISASHSSSGQAVAGVGTEFGQTNAKENFEVYMKVVKMGTSAKIRSHLAGKRPASDIGKKTRRWRVGMPIRVWRLLLTVTLVLVILGAGIQLPQFSHAIETTMKQFLMWVQKDAGAWGPIILALAYVPCSVLAIPASILTLGGGYLFGLWVGFVTDSIGSTLGATAAFLVGRTVGRTYVTSKLKDYPQFQAVGIAVRKSGFKIVLLLRLVPLFPFNVLNYLLSVTPISSTSYILATWFGVMPMTLAFVYAGTTIKDIAEISHGGAHFSRARVIMLAVGFVATILVIFLLTRIARNALRTAIEESGGENDTLIGAAEAFGTTDHLPEVLQPLIIRIDSSVNITDGPISHKPLDSVL